MTGRFVPYAQPDLEPRLAKCNMVVLGGSEESVLEIG